MRDTLAPVIQGFDLSGIVNRYSLQADTVYTEGDNGGTLLDGSTVTDVLAAHSRLSWTLNAISAAQYAALIAALSAGDAPDTVTAYVFDPNFNDVTFSRFHVTRPPFLYAFTHASPMARADAELVLKQSQLIYRFHASPPNQSAYIVGDTLDLTGLAVTRSDKVGNAVDITAQWSITPAHGSRLLTPGPVTVAVSLPDCAAETYLFPVAVSNPVVASGDGWTLYASGLLDVSFVGVMPDYDEYNPRPPWNSHSAQIKSVTLHNTVTRIGEWAFSLYNTLTDVVIPSGVTSVGDYAFAMSALTSVTISEGVASIGDGAFWECDSLTDVYFSGDETAWNQISVGPGNADLLNATIHYHSSGPV